MNIITKVKIGLTIIPIVSLFLIINGCREANNEPEYLINGKIHVIPDGTKVLLYDIEQASKIDSATTKDGIFTMSGIIKHPTLCRLKVDSEYTYFYVENTQIEFESPIKNMHSESKVIGGYEQSLYDSLNVILAPVKIKYEAINDTLLNQKYANNDQRENLIARHRILMDLRRDLIEEFSLENPNSYYSLSQLYFYRKRIGKEALSTTLQNLKEEYQDTRDAKYLKRFVDGQEIELTKGDHFVDFEANTLSGQPFRLSSLKDNFTYLSFWHMSCGPCRKENKHFSKIYNSLPDDFKIVSFSTNMKKEDWKKASEMDGIKWTNVSDLKGSTGEIAMTYSVQALPVSFLIDKEGLIIEKFTGFGDDSIEELMAIIENKRKEIKKG